MTLWRALVVLKLPATNQKSSEISSSLGDRTGDRKNDGVEIGVLEDGSVGSTVPLQQQCLRYKAVAAGQSRG